jgi:pyridoxal phosphate enzyme (YggS family)
VDVETQLRQINKEIAEACNKAGRNPEEITIIAVTKYVTPERAKEALAAGIVHLGENRDEELLHKQEILGTEPVWHFIGTLQSRKVKRIIGKVDFIHSLDRMSLAKEINKRTSATVDCFVQVNTSMEPSKHGMKQEDVIPFVKKLDSFPTIRVVGLMTMAPHTDDEQQIRSCFRKLKTLQREVQELKLPYAPCCELSMGMSNDYKIAIEEGATYIRIGSSLVGNQTGGVSS